MTLPIRIGVQLQPQHSPAYGLMRDAVRRAEDLGVDVAFNWDHFFPLYGDPDGAHYEFVNDDCSVYAGAGGSQPEQRKVAGIKPYVAPKE